MADTTGTIIWKRHYDKASQNKRMKRFCVFYLIPATICIVLMAILKDIYSALGLLIILGLFGLLLFAWLWMIGFNLRMHPTVVEDDGYLCMGRQKVPIDQVMSFSTYMSSVSYSSYGTHSRTRSSIGLGCVTFLLSDRKEIDFKWPALEKEQLDTLRVALEQVLPGKWTPIEKLRQGS
jgi:hypothetical protein